MPRATAQIATPVESFDVRSADGLRLRAHRAGRGPHRWLLPPAMGTPLLCWKYLFEHFAERMTIVTWDQRGTYASEAPRHADGMAFARNLEDGLAVADALGWSRAGPRFVSGGWSMGVQLGLALYERLGPQRIAALALINGPFEHVLSSLRIPLGAPVARGLLGALAAGSPLLTPLLMPAVRRGWAGELMHALRVSVANRAFVVAVTREVGRLDVGRYLRIALELDKHSARPVLERGVAVPTLVTAGSRDLWTPPALARALHAAIPDSEYVEIARGTHYTPLEFPEQLNAALEGFFRRRVFPDRWDAG